ncbi:hypothetical protein DFH06DRAFT_1140469 [Mycena polygramma]|nr:hypothetical protein DFH06DRAFT_1140469 [Mycena polygramma]
MKEFKHSPVPLNSSNTSFDPGGYTSSEQGFSPRARTRSMIHHAHPSSSPRSRPSPTPAALPRITGSSSDLPLARRRPLRIDISQPVRSFSGPLHPETFMPDAPTYSAQLRLSTAESDADLSGEPEIIARHKACVHKGLPTLNKPDLVPSSSVHRAQVHRSFPLELGLLDKVLTSIETRPRIDSRPNGFRVEPSSYKHLIYVLTSRRRKAKDGFALNGKKPPVIPSWGNSYQPEQFYTLADFEILAVCFRVEVEHFLLQLSQFWSFIRRRPIIVHDNVVSTRPGSSPPSSRAQESSDMLSSHPFPRGSDNGLALNGHAVPDIPKRVDIGTELDCHPSITDVASPTVVIPSVSAISSGSTSAAAACGMLESRSRLPESNQPAESPVCTSAFFAHRECIVCSAQPCSTNHGEVETRPHLSSSSGRLDESVGLTNKGVEIQRHMLCLLVYTARQLPRFNGHLALKWRGTSLLGMDHFLGYAYLKESHLPDTATKKARTFNLKASDLCNKIS